MENIRTDSKKKLDPERLAQIRTQCPHCEARFQTTSEHAGKRAKCRKCGEVFVIESVVERTSAPKHQECKDQTEKQINQEHTGTKCKSRAKLYIAAALVLAVVVSVAFAVPVVRYKRAYNTARETGTIQGWQDFMQQHPDASNKDMAATEIDRLRFEQAIAMETSHAMNDFITQYAETAYLGKAQEALAKFSFNEALKEDTLEAYENFVEQFPSGAFQAEADKYIETERYRRAFDAAKGESSVQGWSEFLTDHPNAVDKEYALTEIQQLVYRQAIAAETSAAVSKFLLQYPNSVHVDDAQRNLVRFSFNDACDDNTIEAYESFMERFPGSPFHKEAKECIQNARVDLAYHQEISESLKNLSFDEALAQFAALLQDNQPLSDNINQKRITYTLEALNSKPKENISSNTMANLSSIVIVTEDTPHERYYDAIVLAELGFSVTVAYQLESHEDIMRDYRKIRATLQNGAQQYKRHQGDLNNVKAKYLENVIWGMRADLYSIRLRAWKAMNSLLSALDLNKLKHISDCMKNDGFYPYKLKDMLIEVGVDYYDLKFTLHGAKEQETDNRIHALAAATIKLLE